MKILRTRAELHDARSQWTKVGLVPTMGAFHDGHLELMRQAKMRCDQVLVTLFVNPLQFGPKEDFSRYPRDEERDFRLAESVGVDAIFAPSRDELLPRSTTEVSVAEVSQYWEGSLRPGHFVGVATIVLKLFNLVRPEFAFFGLKDLQQCAVIRRMVEDLNVPLSLEWVEVVRDFDGLALSSRNVYLSVEERERAVEFPRTLFEIQDQLTLGKRLNRQLLLNAKSKLESLGILVDYLTAVDFDTLCESEIVRSSDRLMGAVRIGNVRLLDNIPGFSSSQE